MRATGFRFHPPNVTFSPEQRWVLRRAFGPAECDGGGDFDGSLALGQARAFSLSARIAARTPRERLAAEVGGNAADGFVTDFRIAAASAIQLGQLAREVAAVAGTLGIPVVLLKQAALERAGATRLGARQACDLDLLVPKWRATALRDELLRRGFIGDDFHPEDHQLPPLHHPSGATMEIHMAIPGLRLGRGGVGADADALLRGGLCTPAEGMPAGCFVPTREVLLAHLVVHAIDQHGLAPSSYPLLRAFGDLIDLGFGRGEVAAFEAGPYRWIKRGVSEAELGAVAELCDRLAAGDETLCRGGEAGDEASRLLAHVVAGSLDEGYQRSLGFQRTVRKLHPGSAAALMRELRRTLFLTRLQVDVIYGRPRSAWGYLGWRLLRPFDLGRRLLRDTVSAAGLRQRR